MTKVETMKGKVKEVYNQGYGFVTKHPYKTAATFVAIAAVASLTAAYLLSPAYATFVGKVGTKAATLVSPAITAMSAFAVDHPLLVASLVVLAAVAALITAPVYAYKNINNTDKIEKVKQDILNACKKDSQGNPELENNEVKINEPLSVLSNIAINSGVSRQM